jgi:acetyl-CoA carboxylase carboxyl transferase subunit beta
MEANQKVCPKCGSHHKLTCRERFETFFDNKEFELIETPLPKDDPLNFEDKKKYTDRLKTARKLTGQDDAILIAKGRVQNIDMVVGAQDFRFIGGSFGAASGEAFIAGAQHAIENKMPYVFFSCSGGQRMMESSIALMQMSRTALAVNELKNKKIPFVVVITNPTTGGVTASWAMLGDVILAEKGSVCGFAGKRVIQDTVRETLPDEFQTAEYVRDHGFIDLVIERKYLNSTVGTLLNVLLKKAEAQAKQDSNVTVDKSLQAAS